MRSVGTATMAGWLAALTCATSLAAQVQQTVSVGTEVRVTSMAMEPNQIRGTVLRWQGDTLVLRLRGCDLTCNSMFVASDAIDRLQIHTGRSHVKGALVGTLAGGLFGLLIGAASSGDCGTDPIAQSFTCVGRAAEGGGIGMLAGLVIGAAAGVGDTWRDVPVSSSTAHLGVLPRGPRNVAVTVSVPF